MTTPFAKLGQHSGYLAYFYCQAANQEVLATCQGLSGHPLTEKVKGIVEKHLAEANASLARSVQFSPFTKLDNEDIQIGGYDLITSKFEDLRERLLGSLKKQPPAGPFNNGPTPTPPTIA